MNAGSGARSMTFRAKPPEAFAALREAARRTGYQFLSGDVSTGTAVFTSGKFLLGSGDKVTARITQVAPGTVQVTLSSGPKLGLGSWSRRRVGGTDRLSEALSGLLQRLE